VNQRKRERGSLPVARLFNGGVKKDTQFLARRRGGTLRLPGKERESSQKKKGPGRGKGWRSRRENFRSKEREKGVTKSFPRKEKGRSRFSICRKNARAPQKKRGSQSWEKGGGGVCRGGGRGPRVKSEKVS